MRQYLIDYKKWTALLLPTMLRKPLLMVLLQCATVRIRQKHSELLQKREDNLYRLHHTGQVCYLRAALNDAFAGRSCDFVIEDSEVTSEWIYVLSETEYPYDQLLIKSETETDGVTVWSEDYILIETTPFMVGVPPEIYASADEMDKVRHIVNGYKLLSKKAIYASL